MVKYSPSRKINSIRVVLPSVTRGLQPVCQTRFPENCPTPSAAYEILRSNFPCSLQTSKQKPRARCTQEPVSRLCRCQFATFVRTRSAFGMMVGGEQHVERRHDEQREQRADRKTG